jgi:hypothetical protein
VLYPGEEFKNHHFRKEELRKGLFGSPKKSEDTLSI